MFDALQADVKRALDLAFDALTTPERLGLLQLCEKLRRQLPAIEHPLINQIGEQADATELGGKLPSALADRLLITRARPPAAFMLYAQDRGCTAPSCDVPAYFTEIHHGFFSRELRSCGLLRLRSAGRGQQQERDEMCVV